MTVGGGGTVAARQPRHVPAAAFYEPRPKGRTTSSCEATTASACGVPKLDLPFHRRHDRADGQRRRSRPEPDQRRSSTTRATPATSSSPRASPRLRAGSPSWSAPKGSWTPGRRPTPGRGLHSSSPPTERLDTRRVGLRVDPALPRSRAWPTATTGSCVRGKDNAGNWGELFTAAAGRRPGRADPRVRSPPPRTRPTAPRPWPSAGPTSEKRPQRCRDLARDDRPWARASDPGHDLGRPGRDPGDRHRRGAALHGRHPGGQRPDPGQGRQLEQHQERPSSPSAEATRLPVPRRPCSGSASQTGNVTASPGRRHPADRRRNQGMLATAAGQRAGVRRDRPRGRPRRGPAAFALNRNTLRDLDQRPSSRCSTDARGAGHRRLLGPDADDLGRGAQLRAVLTRSNGTVIEGAWSNFTTGPHLLSPYLGVRAGGWGRHRGQLRVTLDNTVLINQFADTVAGRSRRVRLGVVDATTPLLARR